MAYYVEPRPPRRSPLRSFVVGWPTTCRHRADPRQAGRARRRPVLPRREGARETGSRSWFCSGAWWTATIPRAREDLGAFLAGQFAGRSARTDGETTDHEAQRIAEYDPAPRAQGRALVPLGAAGQVRGHVPVHVGRATRGTDAARARSRCGNGTAARRDRAPRPATQTRGNDLGHGRRGGGARRQPARPRVGGLPLRREARSLPGGRAGVAAREHRDPLPATCALRARRW